MTFKVVVAISAFVLFVNCAEQKSGSGKDPGPSFLLPDIPASLLDANVDVEASDLIYVWINRIKQHSAAHTGPSLRANLLTNQVGRTPSSIFAVDPDKMSQLVPQDKRHPLYSEKFTHLSDEFLLDSMSSDIVDATKFDTPEGATIQTLSGKDLLFKQTGNVLTVNEVPIKTIHQTFAKEPVTVFVLEDFLFNHRKDVLDAFQVLSKGSN